MVSAESHQNLALFTKLFNRAEKDGKPQGLQPLRKRKKEEINHGNSADEG